MPWAYYFATQEMGILDSGSASLCKQAEVSGGCVRTSIPSPMQVLFSLEPINRRIGKNRTGGRGRTQVRRCPHSRPCSPPTSRTPLFIFRNLCRPVKFIALRIDRRQYAELAERRLRWAKLADAHAGHSHKASLYHPLATKVLSSPSRPTRYFSSPFHQTRSLPCEYHQEERVKFSISSFSGGQEKGRYMFMVTFLCVLLTEEEEQGGVCSYQSLLNL